MGTYGEHKTNPWRAQAPCPAGQHCNAPHRSCSVASIEQLSRDFEDRRLGFVAQAAASSASVQQA
ncbi:hypothetical protein CUJ87_21715 [Paraburkholderia caledonica]|nr:hypothetical protein CUJ87_21715 [Paraburkholderia caledonica]